MAQSAIIVSNIPSLCSKRDLFKHFSNDRLGGGPVRYILFPLGEDFKRALVVFEDSRVVHTVVGRKHDMYGTSLKARPAPRQTYQRCTAEVDPLVISMLADLSKCAELLRREYAVQVEMCVDTGQMTLTGTLPQIQAAKSRLDDLVHVEQYKERVNLLNIGDPRHPESRHKGSTWDEHVNADDRLNQSLPPIYFHEFTPREAWETSKRAPTTVQLTPESTLDRSETHNRRAERADESRKETHRILPAHLQREVQKRMRSSDEWIVRGSPVAGRTDNGRSEKTSLELDTLLVRFMLKMHGHKIKAIETKHEVRVNVEEKDINCSIVHLTPEEDLDGAYILLRQAKEDLVDLYQMVHYAVIKERVYVDPRGIKREEYDAMVSAVRQAFLKTLVLHDDYAAGELALVGEWNHVSVAVDWMKSKVQLSNAGTRQMSGSTTPRGLRSEYIVDSSTGKPKLVLILGSSGAMEDTSGSRTARSWTGSGLRLDGSRQSAPASAVRSGTCPAKMVTSSPTGNLRTDLGRTDRPQSSPGPGKSPTSTNEQALRQNVVAQRLADEMKARMLRSEVDNAPSGKPEGENVLVQQIDETDTGQPRASLEHQARAEQLSSPNRQRVQNVIAARIAEEMRTRMLEKQATIENARGDDVENAVDAELGDFKDVVDAVIDPRSSGRSPAVGSAEDDAGPAAESHDVFHLRTEEGVSVHIHTGDIIKTKMDALVCAANENLRNTGGMARDVSLAAGSGFQEMCTEHVTKYGSLKVSEVAPVPARGQLQCKYVLFAVSPMWCLYTNKETCAGMLRTTFLNAFNLANTVLDAESVATPTISSGVYDIPLDVCARALYEAVVDYSRQMGDTSNLRHIHIISKDEESSSVMQVIFQQLHEVSDRNPDSENGYESDISSMVGDDVEVDRDSRKSLKLPGAGEGAETVPKEVVTSARESLASPGTQQDELQEMEAEEEEEQQQQQQQQQQQHDEEEHQAFGMPEVVDQYLREAAEGQEEQVNAADAIDLGVDDFGCENESESTEVDLPFATPPTSPVISPRGSGYQSAHSDVAESPREGRTPMTSPRGSGYQSPHSAVAESPREGRTPITSPRGSGYQSPHSAVAESPREGRAPITSPREGKTPITSPRGSGYQSPHSAVAESPREGRTPMTSPREGRTPITSPRGSGYQSPHSASITESPREGGTPITSPRGSGYRSPHSVVVESPREGGTPITSTRGSGYQSPLNTVEQSPREGRTPVTSPRDMGYQSPHSAVAESPREGGTPINSQREMGYQSPLSAVVESPREGRTPISSPRGSGYLLSHSAVAESPREGGTPITSPRGSGYQSPLGTVGQSPREGRTPVTSPRVSGYQSPHSAVAESPREGGTPINSQRDMGYQSPHSAVAESPREDRTPITSPRGSGYQSPHSAVAESPREGGTPITSPRGSGYQSPHSAVAELPREDRTPITSPRGSGYQSPHSAVAESPREGGTPITSPRGSGYQSPHSAVAESPRESRTPITSPRDMGYQSPHSALAESHREGGTPITSPRGSGYQSPHSTLVESHKEGGTPITSPRGAGYQSPHSAAAKSPREGRTPITSPRGSGYQSPHSAAAESPREGGTPITSPRGSGYQSPHSAVAKSPKDGRTPMTSPREGRTPITSLREGSTPITSPRGSGYQSPHSAVAESPREGGTPITSPRGSGYQSPHSAVAKSPKDGRTPITSPREGRTPITSPRDMGYQSPHSVLAESPREGRTPVTSPRGSRYQSPHSAVAESLREGGTPITSPRVLGYQSRDSAVEQSPREGRTPIITSPRGSGFQSPHSAVAESPREGRTPITSPREGRTPVTSPRGSGYQSPHSAVAESPTEGRTPITSPRGSGYQSPHCDATKSPINGLSPTTLPTGLSNGEHDHSELGSVPVDSVQSPKNSVSSKPDTHFELQNGVGETFQSIHISKGLSRVSPKRMRAIVRGNQPRGITMHVEADRKISLSGEAIPGAIVIKYKFPPSCSNDLQVSFLPNTADGRDVLQLLKKAFAAGILFTADEAGRIQFVNVEQKTNTSGGPEQNGFPDSGYLASVRQQLADCGITEG